MKYYTPNIKDTIAISKIKDAIFNEIPFSLTRFGDGEIYFLNDNIPPKIQKQLREVWGYEDMKQAREDFVKIFNRALAYSTMIGLMNPNNEISKNINYKKETWSISKSYLDNVRRGKLLIADHMITRGPILGDPYKFKDILSGKDIAIVSPRADELKNSPIAEILNVNISYVKTPMGILASDRNDIFKELDKIKEPVVLFGSSITGKDFGVYLQGRGKVALDYGATLDAWAGIKSRKWFSDIQSHCFIKNKK